MMSPHRGAVKRGGRGAEQDRVHARETRAKADSVKRAKRAPRVVHDPMFGDIPLLPEIYRSPDGREQEVWRYDPDYSPAMPPGAVRGDVRRQEYCPMCHTPRYFYVDAERRCVQCGAAFTFRAAEQKHWYETLKFYPGSTAVRCPDCRRKRRSERALQARMAESVAHVDEHPTDPAVLLELAEATVELRERTGAGRIDRALAAIRLARRLAPTLAESHFWEAELQRLSGRDDRARTSYETFLETLGSGARQARLARLARERLTPAVPKLPDKGPRGEAAPGRRRDA